MTQESKTINWMRIEIRMSGLLTRLNPAYFGYSKEWDCSKWQAHHTHFIMNSIGTVWVIRCLIFYLINFLYYQTKVIPILTYACPAWYMYIIEESKTKLERHQSMCLRIIYPNVKSYTTRLQLASIDWLNSVMLNLCLRYVHKIRDD